MRNDNMHIYMISHKQGRTESKLIYNKVPHMGTKSNAKNTKVLTYTYIWSKSET